MSGMHDLSEYVFPDRKIEARKHRFRIIGEDIAAYFSRLAREEYDCNDPIIFRTSCVDPLADEYFQRVRLFKFNNGFRPDERINPPKMAALMVEACKRRDGDAPLFIVPSVLQGRTIDHMVYLQYIYALIVSTLFIRLDEVPRNHERDLFCA